AGLFLFPGDRLQRGFLIWEDEAGFGLRLLLIEGGMSSVSTASDLIDAKLEERQVFGSKHCPGCGHNLLQGSKPDWVGLPAGVKFDPTDQELIEHLEAKVEGKTNSNLSHPLIDEFIPTIQGEDGICYTHPEKLPGVSKDGLSRHFFHRPSKAYTTGTRKRRKIQTEEGGGGGGEQQPGAGGETRWHKTGKTRAVLVNGKHKGCKKILVLYTNFGKNRKPEKTSWVMHQYHLGLDEEEKDGELVVSKIFYQTQPRQCSWVADRRTLAKQKDLMHHHRHLLPTVSTATTPAALEMHHQLKTDPFAYVPFSKGFSEASGKVAQGGSMSSAAAAGEDHEQQMAFHDTRPATHPISQMNMMSAGPPPALLHHASIMLDHHHHHSFHVPTINLQNHSFQQHQAQQQTEQQNHKIGGRSASGLEEIMMACTSSSSTDVKEESSITNTQDAEWLMKYSTSFWHDPDNPDHHG
ncbi:hypothetical protein V2J09_017877, partial [Rumex salicifolius]